MRHGIQSKHVGCAGHHVTGWVWWWAMALALGGALAGCGPDAGTPAQQPEPVQQPHPPNIARAIVDPAGAPFAGSYLVACRPGVAAECLYVKVDAGIAIFAWNDFRTWAADDRPQALRANVYDTASGAWSQQVVLDFGGTNATPIRLASFLGTGQLQVDVTDTAGKPLPHAVIHARVHVPDHTGGPGYYGPAYLTSAAADRDGRVLLTALPESVTLFSVHPLGRSDERAVTVLQDRTTSSALVIAPDLRAAPALAMLTASLVENPVGTDRKNVQLRVRYQTNLAPSISFHAGVYGLWRDAQGKQPARLADEAFQSRDDVSSLLASPAGSGAYDAVLLLDQGERIIEADYYGLRYYAARHFIGRARADDQVSVAGFAGQQATGSPALLPQLPLWIPGGSADAGITSLEALTGGSSPVFDALQAAIALAASQASPARTGAVVAYLGGGDDSGLSSAEHQQRIDSLRTQLAVTGVRLILIAANPRQGGEATPQRDVMELASALQVPFITDGESTWYGQGNDPYSAMELAADLLAGKASTYETRLSLQFRTGEAFDSGSTWVGRGGLYAEDGAWGYEFGDLLFSLRIP